MPSKKTRRSAPKKTAIESQAGTSKEKATLKILIIGDPFVGKTSLVQRYVNGTFYKNYKGTIGVDFAMKVVKWGQDEKLKIQLWDMAGQERYTSMTRVYYRDAHGCLVMFDLSNRTSFLNVVKWKKDFDAKCTLPDGQPIPCLLVANKLDMERSRQVTVEEADRLCAEQNFASWTEISVKENKGVEDCLQYLIKGVMAVGTDSYGTGTSNGRVGNIRLHKVPESERGRGCCR